MIKSYWLALPILINSMYDSITTLINIAMRILQIFYTVLLCIIYLNREQENSFETSVDKRSVQIEERNNIEKTAKINNLKATDNAVFIIKNEEQIENAIPYKSKTFWYESWLKIKEFFGV